MNFSRHGLQWLLRFVHKDSAHKTADAHDVSSPETEKKIVGDRGIASVNRARSAQSRISNLLATGLVSTLGLGLLTWYYVQTFSRRAQAQHTAQTASTAKAQGEMPLPALGDINSPNNVSSVDTPSHSIAERTLGLRPDLPQSQANARATHYETAPTNSAAAEKTPEQLATERRLSGAVFSASSEPAVRVEGSGTRAGVQDVKNPMPVAADGNAMTNGEQVANSVASLLKPSVMAAVSARVLPTERMLLPKGAFIDCTLETAIDTSLPGLTTCITATDTFSADGKVVLLERGTKLVGETRGEVRQGSARVFVLWSEARTPTGVVVPLASPGTDELGRSGLAGQVDRHFLDRFGAAILISVIDGAIQSAVQSKSSGGTVIYNPSSSEDIVTEVLKSTINIPPTVVKQNGDRIQILVARDLDFRSVYELHAVTSR
jgi:type IV secretion system protein VirB10